MTPTYFRVDARLEYLLKKFQDSAFDDYARAHIANYACVLLCGLLETAVRETLSLHSERAASPAVANYVRTQLVGFQNPNPEKIEQLVRSFDVALADQLEAFWSGEIKDAIGSIVGNRHLVAHGRDTALTLNRIWEWLTSVRSFITFLETKFS
jgi:RiboL-PSP-HEPN